MRREFLEKIKIAAQEIYEEGDNDSFDSYKEAKTAINRALKAAKKELKADIAKAYPGAANKEKRKEEFESIKTTLDSHAQAYRELARKDLEEFETEIDTYYTELLNVTGIDHGFTDEAYAPFNFVTDDPAEFFGSTDDKPTPGWYDRVEAKSKPGKETFKEEVIGAEAAEWKKEIAEFQDPKDKKEIKSDKVKEFQQWIDLHRDTLRQLCLRALPSKNGTKYIVNLSRLDQDDFLKTNLGLYDLFGDLTNRITVINNGTRRRGILDHNAKRTFSELKGGYKIQTPAKGEKPYLSLTNGTIIETSVLEAGTKKAVNSRAKEIPLKISYTPAQIDKITTEMFAALGGYGTPIGFVIPIEYGTRDKTKRKEEVGFKFHKEEFGKLLYQSTKYNNNLEIRIDYQKKEYSIYHYTKTNSAKKVRHVYITKNPSEAKKILSNTVQKLEQERPNEFLGDGNFYSIHYHCRNQSIDKLLKEYEAQNATYETENGTMTYSFNLIDRKITQEFSQTRITDKNLGDIIKLLKENASNPVGDKITFKNCSFNLTEKSKQQLEEYWPTTRIIFENCTLSPETVEFFSLIPDLDQIEFKNTHLSRKKLGFLNRAKARLIKISNSALITDVHAERLLQDEYGRDIKMPDLEILDLSNTAITDKAISLIKKKNLPSLGILNLRGCEKLSDKAAAKLKTEFGEGLKIYTEAARQAALQQNDKQRLEKKLATLQEEAKKLATPLLGIKETIKEAFTKQALGINKKFEETILKKIEEMDYDLNGISYKEDDSRSKLSKDLANCVRLAKIDPEKFLERFPNFIGFNEKEAKIDYPTEGVSYENHPVIKPLLDTLQTDKESYLSDEIKELYKQQTIALAGAQKALKEFQKQISEVEAAISEIKTNNHSIETDEPDYTLEPRPTRLGFLANIPKNPIKAWSTDSIKQLLSNQTYLNQDGNVDELTLEYYLLEAISGALSEDKLTFIKLAWKKKDKFLAEEGEQMFQRAKKEFDHKEWKTPEKRKELIKIIDFALESTAPGMIDFEAKLTKDPDNTYDLIFQNSEYEEWNNTQKFCYRRERQLPGFTNWFRAKLMQYRREVYSTAYNKEERATAKTTNKVETIKTNTGVSINFTTAETATTEDLRKIHDKSADIEKAIKAAKIKEASNVSILITTKEALETPTPLFEKGEITVVITPDHSLDAITTALKKAKKRAATHKKEQGKTSTYLNEKTKSFNDSGEGIKVIHSVELQEGIELSKEKAKEVRRKGKIVLKAANKVKKSLPEEDQTIFAEMKIMLVESAQDATDFQNQNLIVINTTEGSDAPTPDQIAETPLALLKERTTIGTESNSVTLFLNFNDVKEDMETKIADAIAQYGLLTEEKIEEAKKDELLKDAENTMGIALLAIEDSFKEKVSSEKLETLLEENFNAEKKTEIETEMAAEGLSYDELLTNSNIIVTITDTERLFLAFSTEELGDTSIYIAPSEVKTKFIQVGRALKLINQWSKGIGIPNFGINAYKDSAINSYKCKEAIPEDWAETFKTGAASFYDKHLTEEGKRTLPSKIKLLLQDHGVQKSPFITEKDKTLRAPVPYTASAEEVEQALLKAATLYVETNDAAGLLKVKKNGGFQAPSTQL
jgi:hypothetical protein